MDDEEMEESFFLKNIGTIIFAAVIFVALGIGTYIWFVPSQVQECEYTNNGCYPGEGTKFDQ